MLHSTDNRTTHHTSPTRDSQITQLTKRLNEPVKRLVSF